MNPKLHAVPTDNLTPYPVSLARVGGTLQELYSQADQRIDLPQKTLSATLEGIPFFFCLGRAGGAFSIRGVWDTNQPYEPTEQLLFAAADTWNRERYFPTVYVIKNHQDTAEVVADHLIQCREVLSNQQLEGALRVGVATGLDALRFMRDASASILHIPTATAEHD